MVDLFKAEWRRFMRLACIVGAVTLFLLAFMTRMVDLLQQPLLVYRVGAFIAAFMGILLAAVQMAMHRRPNAWLYLLHRPVAPAGIAMALSGAAACALFVAIALPVLLALLGVEWMTVRIVDARHWLLPMCGWAIAFASYLTCACIVLAPRRGMVFLLCLPLAMLAPFSGVYALLVQLAVVALAGGVLLAFFKPNLQGMPRSPIAHVTVIVLMQIGVTIALYWALTLGTEFGLMAIGRHPLNGIPPSGGYAEAERADSATLLRHGIGLAPAHALLREQAGIAEQAAWGPGVANYPRYGQISAPMPLEIEDETRHVRWSFSHDHGAFHGIRLTDQSDAGWLGRDGIVQGTLTDADRFEQPPLVFEDRYLITEHQLYQFDANDQSMHLRVNFPDDEHFTAAPKTLGGRVMILGSRRLHMVNAHDLTQQRDVLHDEYVLPLDGAIDNMGRVDVAELLDGYLVSFLHGRQSYHQDVAAWQTVYRIHEDGRAELLNRRELGRDYPVWFRHLGWWASPVYYGLQHRLGWIASDDAEGLPTSIGMMIATLGLLCLAATAWWLSAVRMSRTSRLTWIVANGIVGLPGLIACLLLYPSRERTAKPVLPRTASAPA
ncbi:MULTISPECIES: hypothetical protein [Dyella]|uniref:Uncharacterized protein n=2 Tax=Dyella TaxID=231454 RepID=A0A4R0YS70_9GAMM|nr:MULTISPECIES: hypothetical protein [Dyella]TBR40243.1 hypothetical protein EYV96_08775 [Dyella terrae]TCI12175.1 hypothetical protein EZM97_02095 [Dyella soli]